MDGTHDETNPRLRLGDEGERIAADFLRRAGYRIVASNVRAAGVELDLVAQRGRLFAVVEVKTRRGARHGAPEEAVDLRKQARLARGAAAWLREHAGPGARARLDVIAVEIGAGAPRVRHWPAAFEAPMD